MPTKQKHGCQDSALNGVERCCREPQMVENSDPRGSWVVALIYRTKRHQRSGWTWILTFDHLVKTLSPMDNDVGGFWTEVWKHGGKCSIIQKLSVVLQLMGGIKIFKRNPKEIQNCDWCELAESKPTKGISKKRNGVGSGVLEGESRNSLFPNVSLWSLWPTYDAPSGYAISLFHHLQIFTEISSF